MCKTHLLVCVVCLALGRGGAVASRPGSGSEIIRGPYLQFPMDGTDSMNVVWWTSSPTYGSLIWGEGSEWNDDWKRVPSQGTGVLHKAALKGLDPTKSYHYRVEAGGRFSKTYSFRPFPRREKKYSFIVYGDSRWNHAAHQAVVSQMASCDSRFVIHTGDMVTSGERLGEWDNFFFVIRPVAARMPLFPVVGNHEYSSGDAALFKALFFLPRNSPAPALDYFFDTGNARFIIMDNRRVGKQKGEQKGWLASVLDDAKAEKRLKHIFVFLHQGIQSSGPHGPAKGLEKHGYLDLMKKGGVKLVVAGHDHIYERGRFKELSYMVSGGGGAPIYRKEVKRPGVQKRASEHHFVWFTIDGDKVAFKVYRPDGSLIESCTLQKTGFGCY